ncbi:unnamed protein product [Caenorhabditis auriculariae]|uniref:Saposin B-type domain-containing protein n=1 Tax=Caenorhabditis auriculariae TaxID=2777116 RepID=A0A8S1HQ07_9PELO|nr:unnamed protein product [Caenorhabditis auriculariae]
MQKLIILIVLAGMIMARTQKSKPLCGLCMNIVQQLDEALKHGDDVEKAIYKFCKEDVPGFLVEMCHKVIEKNIDEIIEKLKKHEPAEQICNDILLCHD